MANILISTEGGQVGLGHVQRCIILADELRRDGHHIYFELPVDTNRIVLDRIRLTGHILSRDTVVPRCDMLIVDVEQYPGLEFMQAMRAKYRRVVIIGGVSYPPVGELAKYVDLIVYSGELFDSNETVSAHILNGPEHIIIHPAFRECKPNGDGPIVVSMGGRDPFNLTPRISEALKGLRHIRLIVGPAHANSGTYYHDAIYNPASLLSYFDGASLAIVTTGMTAYEAMAAGVPTLAYNISPDHERTARELHKRGALVNMGACENFDAQALQSMIGVMFDAWDRYSDTGRALVDGRGVFRVAEAIEKL